jgi:hypothetical protein
MAISTLDCRQVAISAVADAGKNLRKSGTKGFSRRKKSGGPESRSVFPCERPIHLPPQSVAMLNMEQLGVLKHLEQFSRLSYVLSASGPVNKERSVLNEISDASIDLGLSAVELSVQLSQILHLARLDGVLL